MRARRAAMALMVAGLFVGTACTAPQVPEQPAGEPPEAVIVGFGDSIVYGSNYPRPWLYSMLDRLAAGEIAYRPEWLWVWDAPSARNDRWYEADGMRVYNSGIDGNTTQQMTSRFERDVVGVEADTCLILGGANDVFRDVDPAVTRENLASLYARCEDAGITPVACTLVPVSAGFLVGDQAVADELNGSIDRLNAWIVEHCTANGIAVVDFNAVVGRDPSRFLQPDGIHPSEDGHEAMGGSIDLVVLGL